MELREPPRPAVKPRGSAALRWLSVASVLALAALGALVWDRFGVARGGGSEDEILRQVAGKLQAAGAVEEASAVYEDYLERGAATGETGARIAYSLGLAYLESGRYEKALRWFYEAESRGAGDLAPEVGKKIVHSLEGLGRHHAARAALDSRSRPPAERDPGAGDPVVAKIGEEEIRRSEVERALEDLPPELAARFDDPEQRRRLLERYVADELMWRKAVKLEYDRDPEVLRRHATALKQLAVGKLVERELLARIDIDEADLRIYFEANKERYRAPGEEEGGAPPPAFDRVRAAVERDYRRFKLEAGYGEMIDSALAAEGVELFPERLAADG